MTREKIILPVAKQAGLTSFGTLRQFKKLLGTEKIGHTGVLDNFADGLLVCLIAHGTKLSSYFTSCDKKYQAFFIFGTETDTLDYFGKVVAETDLPLFSKFTEVLPLFKGRQNQVPPLYSGVQVNGVRSYKAAYAGTPLALPSRNIEIYSIELTAYELTENGKHLKTATLDVHCSKGTYVRSLCRDIAHSCGSTGFVGALRRTQVGHFCLSESLGADLLPDFAELCTTRDESLRRDATRRENKIYTTFTVSQLENKALAFTEEFAQSIGIAIAELKPEFLTHFQNGQPIKKAHFFNFEENAKSTAVFCKGSFCGMIHHNKTENKIEYDFVVPKIKSE